MPLESDRSFIVFQVGDTLGALPLDAVERVAPMAELARPPGLPVPLEGILNLGGHPVPVLRLDHLLQLPETRPGLYSMLLLTKRETQKMGMLVDRVSEILRVADQEVVPVRKEDSFNACVQATIRHGEQLIHVLSAERILNRSEREALDAFVDLQRSRLAGWGRTIQ